MSEFFESPEEALSKAKVDLCNLIRQGIPERQFVPGSNWLIAGKRYLIPAPAGGGKSLLALVHAIDIVEAGGTVAILDVENGCEEYARRLSDILAARGNPAIASALDEGRLRYYEWPQIDLDDERWAASFEGVDVVFFDSSRLMLSVAGLNEDSNDDIAEFVHGALLPLSRRGITTVVLDNTGHEGERARGAKAKEDLNEVVYVLRSGSKFDREKTGTVRMVRTRSRFADLPTELIVQLGGGTYGPISDAANDDADGLDDLLEAIREEPGRSAEALAKAVGGRRSRTPSRLRRLEEAGTAYRAPSQITDGAGRTRTINGWFPASDGHSHPVPPAGTAGTVGQSEGQPVPPSPLLRSGTGDGLDPDPGSEQPPEAEAR
jgi:hypothetical protein